MVFRDRSTSRDPLRSILYKLCSVKDELRRVLSSVFFGRLIFKNWQIWRCREIVISVASLVFPTICCPEQCSNRRRIQDSVFLLIPICSLNFPNILLRRFSLACCNLAKFHFINFCFANYHLHVIRTPPFLLLSGCLQSRPLTTWQVSTNTTPWTSMIRTD